MASRGAEMTESLMLIALGFLAATFIAIIATRLVWLRAVKITRRETTDPADLPQAQTAPAHDPRVPLLQAKLDEKTAELAHLSSEITRIVAETDRLETAAGQTPNADILAGEIAALREQRDQLREQVADEQKAHLATQTKLRALVKKAGLLVKAMADIASSPTPAAGPRSKKKPDTPNTANPSNPLNGPNPLNGKDMLHTDDPGRPRAEEVQAATPAPERAQRPIVPEPPAPPKSLSLSERIKALQDGISQT